MHLEKKTVFDWNDPENFSVAWMIEHAEAGRTDMCMKAIDRGVPVNGRGPNGETALNQAARHMHIGTSFALLDRGADILLRDGDGDSVLHKAWAWDARDILRLVKLGADVNARNHANGTPLMCAMDVNQAKVLLEHHADTNAAADNGQTIFMTAAWARNKPLCILLAEFGADVNAYNHHQQAGTALHRAMVKNDTEMGALLVALGARPQIRNSGRNDEWRRLMGMPRLHAAAMCGQTKLALSLVNGPEDLEEKYRRKTADAIAKEHRFHDTAGALQSLRASMAIDAIQSNPRKTEKASFRMD